MTREEKAKYCIDNPKKTPAFQFYPDNWWGSRHVALMSAQQRGIHASLIFSAWLESNCGIPEKEVCLSARIPENLKEETQKVLEWCWFLFEGFWFCERLLNERVKQVNLSKIRISTGSEGGRPVKSKIYKKKPIANQLDSKCKPNDNQMITKSEEEDEIENRKENAIENPLIQDVLNYLNEKLKTHYRTDTAGYISQRLKEGFTLADFQKVIDKKIKTWLNNPKMQSYLRPKTLFSPEHFSEYLNEIDYIEENHPYHKGLQA